MKDIGHLIWKRKIALTTADLKELNSLLLKHCDYLKFEIKTKNDSRIEFSTFDELSGYANFRESKILALSIQGFINEDKFFSVVTIVFRRNYPYINDNIECDYRFENEDKKKTLIWDLNDFLKKRKRYNNIALIVKLVAQIASLLLFISPLLFKSARLNLCEYIIGPFRIFKLAICLFLIAIFIAFIVMPPIFKWLFPDVLFLWGEVGNEHERRVGWLKNFFWLVLGIILDRLIACLF